MASLRPTQPLTPLDALRHELQEYSDGQTSFPQDLASRVQRLRKVALKVLRSTLLDPTQARGLKRAVLGLCSRFDWLDWVPILEELIAKENDLGLFDEACAALGGLGYAQAREALERLSALRQEPDRQVILQRERTLFEPQQPFDHYLGRLQEGQANLRLAHQGARYLGGMPTPERVADLGRILEASDPLVPHLGRKVLASWPLPEARARLLTHLADLQREFQERRLLGRLVEKAAIQARHTVRETLISLVDERMGTRDGVAVTRLKGALHSEESNLGSLTEPLRLLASGPYEAFLLEATALLLDSKVARFTALVAEVGTANEARLQHLQEAAEALAELLGALQEQEQVQADALRPVLEACHQTGLGGNGLLQVWVKLIPVDAVDALAQLLDTPDPELRLKRLDALGAREEDALTPVFLRAMQDPIVEVGQRAMHHLGRLPSSFPALMALFESGQVESTRRAIRVFGENRTRLAAEPLVAFIARDSHDELLVEAVDALAEIRHPSSTPVLLDLLHDGKPLALQLSIARALALLEAPQASLGLLGKAPLLKAPGVLILALEGALAAFRDFRHPLPNTELPAFLTLFERCCDLREGEGQRIRAMFACESLYVFDRTAYTRLKDRFSDFLSELRLQENWDRDMNERVGALVKEMGRRAELLGRLSNLEGEVRGRMQKLGPSGGGRADELLAIRDALSSPELILRPEMAREVADFVLEHLASRPQEWRETAHLCEIGGLTGCSDLVDPIRAILQRASGLGLRSACQKALQQLGLSPSAMDRRPPVRRILVLDPSAFFRRRLVAALAPNTSWEVLDAGSRVEAEALLAERAVDALVTEAQDPGGDLQDWAEQAWLDRRIDRVVLSTSDRAAGSSWCGAKMVGLLFKPYPPEVLVDILDA